VVVGEHPGDDEDLLGRPFEDRAGLNLKKLMRMASLPHEQTWLTYAVRCRAKSGAEAKRHSADCKAWLWEELKLLKPKVVVTLGGVPSERLLKVRKLKEQAGVFRPLSFLEGAVAAPWYSPFVVLQGGQKLEKATVAFFEKAKEKLEWS
jgi:uracil-DNA glycosylase family 4